MGEAEGREDTISKADNDKEVDSDDESRPSSRQLGDEDPSTLSVQIQSLPTISQDDKGPPQPRDQNGYEMKGAVSFSKNSGKVKTGGKDADIIAKDLDFDVEDLKGKDSAAKSRSQTAIESRREADVMDFSNAFSLQDETSWASVPREHVLGRFRQYRQMTQTRLGEVDGEIEATIRKTKRKIDTMKAQFLEHKRQWEAEREELVGHLERTTEMHGEVEKEADDAMKQLEQLISEQEKMDDTGDKRKRNEKQDNATTEDGVHVKAISGPFLDPHQANQQRDSNSSGGPHRGLLGSGRRRSSLREMRSVLSSLKQTSERGRAQMSRSPTLVSIRSRSVLAEAELDEFGDMPFPPDVIPEKDDTHSDRRVSTYDSDISSSVAHLKGKLNENLQAKPLVPMHQHPVVLEFLKLYEIVTTFKSDFSNLLLNKDMVLQADAIKAVAIVTFDKSEKVQEQLSKMATSAHNILKKSVSVLELILPNKHDKFKLEKVMTTADTTGKVVTAKSNMSERDVADTVRLAERVNSLEKQLIEEKLSHEERLNESKILTLKLQDTINTLQKDISMRQSEQGSLMPIVSSPTRGQTPPIMFTRLDFERNTTILKKAVNENRVDQETYEKALQTMEDYVSLPAERLAHLATKYVHHKQLQNALHENPKSNSSVDDISSKLLLGGGTKSKKNMSNALAAMKNYRLCLAEELMTTLMEIEQESGIFLIKPMFSYQSSKFYPKKFYGKATSVSQHLKRGRNATSTHLLPPVNSPASKFRPESSRAVPGQQLQPNESPLDEPQRLENGLSGILPPLNGSHPQPMWKQDVVDSLSTKKDLLSYVNTPHIVEMDVNRMLIGMNHISKHANFDGNPNNRLTNSSATTNIRSYMAVNRPAGRKEYHDIRSQSASAQSTSMLPSTPASDSPLSVGATPRKWKFEESSKLK